MIRYIYLFFIHIYINIKELKSYGVDFYLGSVAMLLKNFSNLFIIYSIYNIVHVINGWNINEMIYIYSIITISMSIWRCFFINTLNTSYYVTGGHFDLILAKPIDPLFYIFMQGFDEDAWGDLAIGIILYIYFANILNINIISSILIFIISIFGSLIFAGLSILGSILSLIYVGINNFSDLPYIVFEFAKYPLNIFNPILALLFKSIIPIGFIAYMPSLVALKGVYRGYIIFPLGIIIPIGYFYAVYKLWNLFVHKYSSSGT